MLKCVVTEISTHCWTGSRFVRPVVLCTVAGLDSTATQLFSPQKVKLAVAQVGQGLAMGPNKLFYFPLWNRCMVEYGIENQ